MQNKSRYNLFYRIASSALILLHLFTFGPIRDALAFTSSSASYKLNSGTLNEGGKSRAPKGPGYTKLLTHFDGSLGAATFSDDAGNSITNNAASDTYKVLGLSFDGSTSFIDSARNKAVTANGNAQIDTAQSKFGGSSALFDGNGDFLSLPDSDDWNFGSSDFTIDFWVRFSALPTDTGTMVLFNQHVDGNNDIFFGVKNSADTYYLRVTVNDNTVETVNILKASPSLSLNTWYHIAFVRSGNNWYIFQDGTQLGTTASNSSVIPDFAAALDIGRRSNGSQYFNGWLDDFKVSKGIARLTSNFTPPQAPSGKVFSDTTQAKFGASSARFSGDSYLSIPDSDDWNFGSSDWTIDFWVRFNSLTGQQALYTFFQSAAEEFTINKQADNTLYIDAYSETAGRYSFWYQTTSAVFTSSNTWYHIAALRGGNTLYLFVDGVSQALTEGVTISGKTIPGFTGSAYIGAYGIGSTAYFNGWIDEFRVSKGIARWTANFTPPTAPYTLDEPANIALKLWQDSLAEPAIGRSTSQSYILNSGFISTVASNPPLLTQIIPNQTWKENEAKPAAFDLDDYFSSDTGALTYTVSGNSKIAVSIDPVTNKVSFSSAQAWLGIEKISFTALDAEGNSIQSNQITLQVEGVNNPPVLDFIPDISVNETDLITITPSAQDLDGDTIAYTFSAPLNAQGQWQTDYTSAGAYTITITATDSTGLFDTKTVLINVRNINRAPLLNPIPDITASEGELVTITALASDPDNDALSIYYSAPLDSSGKWLTSYDDAGTYTVTVTASDGIDTVSQPVKIIINNTNRPPQATLTLSKYTVNPNETISITLSASDPDSDVMSYVLKKDASTIAEGEFTRDDGGRTTDEKTFTASFANIGDHTIYAAITDSGGLTATASKGVDVVDPNANRDYINPVMGDFNGDALFDLGLHNSQNGTWEICISDAGTFRNAVDWLSSFGSSRDWWPIGGDFNADSKTDIGIYNNTTGQLQIALSTGSSFTNQGASLTAGFASYSWQPFTGNFNADKYTDFALYNKDTGEVRVALGRGTKDEGGGTSGFAPFSTWLTNFGTDYIALSGDFNADSLSDLCLFKKSSGEFKVAFSNSKEFVDGASWLSGFAADKEALLADFNSDGLTDIGYWDKSSSNWYYAISTGASFVNKGVWLSSFGANADESASTGDFDGNGLTDAATFDKDQIGINRWRTQLSQDKPADLLTEVDNGIGGKTQVAYTYAAKSENGLLPFPVYVASTISLSNTFPADRAATYTQNFSFSGGYYDAQEREFRGFAKVKVTDPITNNYSETYFYQGKPGQDGALKGQLEKIISFDGNNRKISETLNTYEVRKAGPQERVLGFPALIEQTTTVCEENATFITTKDKFTYDNIGNLLEEKGGRIEDGRWTNERITQTVYAQAYEYNSTTQSGFNRPLESSLKDKDGNIVTKKNFEYDSKGNLAKDTVFIFDPLSSLVLHPSSLYTYDSFGNLISSTNALGVTVVTEYETGFYAYPVKVTNSLGHTLTYIYEPKFGVVTSVTDANGVTSTTTYDPLSRPIRGTKDDGRGTQVTAVTYAYPDFNTKVSTNALGFSSTEYIDGLGRKYKTVAQGEDGDSARQVTSEVSYNLRGLTEKESLAHYIDEDLSQISYIRYEYDIRGRIKKTISDFPGTAKDADSQINYLSPLYTETTDPQGHKKGTLKDVFGNIIEVTEFTQGGVYKTKYEYDIQSNLTQTTDSKGNITQIFYDSIGRKLKMLDPDMGAWNYEYDILGNLIKQTDAKGQVLEFQYDALNRLTIKTRDDGRGTKDEVNYLYDDSAKPNCTGRLSKVIDLSGSTPLETMRQQGGELVSLTGSTEFFYDKLGREIKSIKRVSSIEYQVSREYDILDRLTKLTYPDGEVVNYSYDVNSGSLERVYTKDEGGGTKDEYVKDITYNAKGQIKTVSYGNNTKTDYTYGQDLRLSRIFTRDDGRGTTLQDLNYIFDKNGNITTLFDNLRNNGSPREFFYDDLDRLTQAQNVPSPSGGYTNFNYQYDSIGNIIYKSDLGVMTYGLNAGPHALTSASGYTYKYDANGNMTQGKNKTLSYDIENRLIQVNELGAITTFVYDGDGGRVKQHRAKGIGQSETTIYIGSLFEIVTEGTEENPEALRKVKHIFAGANRICTKGLSPQGTDPELYYYHSDHLGSSSIITDSTGAQVQHLEYTPYGTIARNEKGLSPQGTLPDVKHLFTGKELDSTGLYFYGARYYDPEIGRFITADTIVQAPYDPQSLNRYSYCRNNPINYVDPTGHSWKSFWRAIGIVLSVVTIVVGVMTGNPYLIASGALSLVNSATSGYQGGGWNTAHQVMGYSAAALAVAGAFYSPAGSPSAELGYDSAGNYVGTVDLGTITVTKTQAAIQAEQMTQLGNAASGVFAGAQAGITAAGSWLSSNIATPIYNTMMQPGYNYGQWIYGQKNFANFFGASLDSVWAVTGVYGAVETVAASGAPYWQYYPSNNPGYKTPWMTRGWQPPHQTGEQAAKALKLPGWNPGDAVRRTNVKWWEAISGPRRVSGGTGTEFYRGRFTFPKE